MWLLPGTHWFVYLQMPHPTVEPRLKPIRWLPRSLPFWPIFFVLIPFLPAHNTLNAEAYDFCRQRVTQIREWNNVFAFRYYSSDGCAALYMLPQPQPLVRNALHRKSFYDESRITSRTAEKTRRVCLPYPASRGWGGTSGRYKTAMVWPDVDIEVPHMRTYFKRAFPILFRTQVVALKKTCKRQKPLHDILMLFLLTYTIAMLFTCYSHVIYTQKNIWLNQRNVCWVQP